MHKSAQASGLTHSKLRKLVIHVFSFPAAGGEEKESKIHDSGMTVINDLSHSLLSLIIYADAHASFSCSLCQNQIGEGKAATAFCIQGDLSER
jgi:hypothetical protein